jgi:SH2 domain
MAAPSKEARIEQLKASKYFCVDIANKAAEEFLKSHKNEGIIHQEGNQLIYSSYNRLMGRAYHTPIEISENGYKIASSNKTSSTIDDFITSFKNDVPPKPLLTARELTAIKQLGDNLLELSDNETKRFLDKNPERACIRKVAGRFLYTFSTENGIKKREISLSENGFSYIDQFRREVSSPDINKVITDLQNMTHTAVMKTSTYEDNQQRAQLKEQLTKQLSSELMNSPHFLNIPRPEAEAAAKKHGSGVLRPATTCPFALTLINKNGETNHISIFLTDKGYSYADSKSQQPVFAPDIEKLIAGLSESWNTPVLTANRYESLKKLENSEYYAVMTREEANKFLKEHKDPTKIAILRQSSQPNAVSLSFINSEGKTEHSLIEVSDKGVYTFADREARTIPELIKGIQDTSGKTILKANDIEELERRPPSPSSS